LPNASEAWVVRSFSPMTCRERLKTTGSRDVSIEFSCERVTSRKAVMFCVGKAFCLYVRKEEKRERKRRNTASRPARLLYFVGMAFDLYTRIGKEDKREKRKKREVICFVLRRLSIYL
jgi:hypothetical protein